MRVSVAAACAAIGLVMLSGPAAPRITLAAAQPYTNTFNYGSPASPQSVVPSDLDVQIHRRDPSNAMEPMDAGHGADCGAPPATHAITTLAEGVFACKNHMMTAIGDSGYGEIAITPNHMADWSTGTTAITWQVSSQQYNPSDWLEVWLTPFADNQTLPFEPDAIDMQGPPKNALVFSLNMGELVGTYSGDVTPIQNKAMAAKLPKLACTYQYDPQCINPLGSTSVVSPSAVTRLLYEIDISNGHIKFGLPGVVTWTDTDYAVPFSQGIVQLVHHSYNPLKHSPGTGIDTFHWSSFSISNAIPFTIINGAERSINAGTSASINFPAPAPAGSYLRFSALGTISVSTDSGATYVPAVLQEPMLHSEHFTSYMTPIPAGTQSVLVRGTDNQYAQPWWIRDPAIWSLTASGTPSPNPPSPSAPPATSPPPSPQPSPSPSPSPAPPPPPPPPAAGWTSLGGIVTSAAGVSSSGPNSTDVFVRGSDNALWHRSWDGTSWSPWDSLGGTLTSSPSAIAQGPNSIDVFVRGTDEAIWQRSWNGTAWSPWTSIGGIATSAPDAASSGVGRLDVVVRGTDMSLWHRSWNGATWAAWESLGGYVASDPAVVASGAGRLDVFVRGADNAMWHRAADGSGSWGAWVSQGGTFNSSPAATACSAGHFDLYVSGSGGSLWHSGYAGSWSGWEQLSGVWTSDPGAGCAPGTTSVTIAERGTDSSLWVLMVAGT